MRHRDSLSESSCPRVVQLAKYQAVSMSLGPSRFIICSALVALFVAAYRLTALESAHWTRRHCNLHTTAADAFPGA